MRLIGPANEEVYTSWAWLMLGAEGVYETDNPARMAELVSLGFTEPDTAPDDKADMIDDTNEAGVEEVQTTLLVPADDVVSIAEAGLDDDVAPILGAAPAARKPGRPRKQG